MHVGLIEGTLEGKVGKVSDDFVEFLDLVNGLRPQTKEKLLKHLLGRRFSIY